MYKTMTMIPVYSLIQSQLKSTDTISDLTDVEKEQFIKNVLGMDKVGLELMYCIIRSYEIDKGLDNTLPFNGKILKSGVRFELDSFDIPLKHMLKKFIEMHHNHNRGSNYTKQIEV